MKNRSGQNGFVMSTENTTATVTDLALVNGASNSQRTIRLESRAAFYTTGIHSLQIGLVSGTPTLSIGDTYANITNKLYVGTQTTVNSTPSDTLTVNGSIKANSITIGSASVLTTNLKPLFLRR